MGEAIIAGEGTVPKIDDHKRPVLAMPSVNWYDPNKLIRVWWRAVDSGYLGQLVSELCSNQNGTVVHYLTSGLLKPVPKVLGRSSLPQARDFVAGKEHGLRAVHEWYRQFEESAARVDDGVFKADPWVCQDLNIISGEDLCR